MLTSGLVLSGVAADAHHSLYGVYDTRREVTIEAIVAAFHFVNPHPYVQADVRDGSGRTRQWRLEMDNRRELVDVGMTDATLKAGDRILATGNPGRSTELPTLYVRALDRPADGLEYKQIGNDPRLRFPKR